jgi:UDP-N-acetyl-D-mannosaminuronate dehydrogenase
MGEDENKKRERRHQEDLERLRGFRPIDDTFMRGVNIMKNYKIAVAGTGYVGLSIATLLSQHHKVTAVDIVPEKVEMINNRKSPIQDDYIEKYLAEKDLNLTATLDAKAAYSDCCFHIFFIPFTNNVLLPQISFFTSQPTRMERCLLLTS